MKEKKRVDSKANNAVLQAARARKRFRLFNNDVTPQRVRDIPGEEKGADNGSTSSLAWNRLLGSSEDKEKQLVMHHAGLLEKRQLKALLHTEIILEIDQKLAPQQYVENILVHILQDQPNDMDEVILQLAQETFEIYKAERTAQLEKSKNLATHFYKLSDKINLI